MEQSRPTRNTNEHPAKYFISFFSSKKLKNQNISPKKKNPLKRTFNNSVCFLRKWKDKSKQQKLALYYSYFWLVSKK